MPKGLMMISITVFGFIGSYIPILLWHAGGFSAWSIFGSMLGGIFGIWAAFKLNNYF
jgi:hypothetical protein